MPEAISGAPFLYPGLEFEYEAFMELNTCRPGGALNSIPWTAIIEYARQQGLDEQDTEDFRYLIRAMDGSWRIYHKDKDDAAKRQQESKVKAPSAKKRRR